MVSPLTSSPPTTATASFGYDKNGNRTSLTDPRGSTQSATYDALNRLLTETTLLATHSCTPSCQTTSVTASSRYTLDGLRASTADFNQYNPSDPSQVTASFSYDSARRLKLINYSGSTPDVGFSYDKGGNRLTLTEAGATAASYEYDELSRPTKAIRDPGPSQKVVEYGYDRRDQTTLKYPDTKLVTNTFDAAGRLQYVDDFRTTGATRTTFGYDDANRKTSQTLPSNAVTSWSYDSASRLQQAEHKTSATGSVFFRASYSYDLAGNRLTQADFDGASTVNLTYQYDAAHRLTQSLP